MHCPPLGKANTMRTTMEKAYAAFGAILIIVAILISAIAQNVTVGIWPVEDPTTRNAIAAIVGIAGTALLALGVSKK